MFGDVERRRRRRGREEEEVGVARRRKKRVEKTVLVSVFVEQKECLVFWLSTTQPSPLARIVPYT